MHSIQPPHLLLCDTFPKTLLKTTTRYRFSGTWTINSRAGCFDMLYNSYKLLLTSLTLTNPMSKNKLCPCKSRSKPFKISAKSQKFSIVIGLTLLVQSLQLFIARGQLNILSSLSNIEDNLGILFQPLSNEAVHPVCLRNLKFQLFTICK